MRFFVASFILTGMLVLVQSCTGQKPAELKNSTIPANPVKGSCSSMVLEGQVLSKKNLLNIFDCSGWAKQYPELNQAIKNADAVVIDEVFKPFNDAFFSDKSKRKAFFKLSAKAEARGDLDAIGLMLENGLGQYKLLTHLNHALNSDALDSAERSQFMHVLSADNQVNTQMVGSVHNILKAFEANKESLSALLSPEDKQKLTERATALFDDFATEMNQQNWKQMSQILYSQNESPLQNWGAEGLRGDLRILLDIVQAPTFQKDLDFLQNSIQNGIYCSNRANTKNFRIDVAYELRHKIDSLKNDPREVFEQMMLHGLTKYLAFQEFCEEKSSKQGLDAFYAVLKYAFKVLPSDHDYRFLKRLHQIFGENRYVFVAFLTSDTFKALRSQLIDLKATGNDEDFVRALYQVLADSSADDLKPLAKLVAGFSESDSVESKWNNSFSKIWQSFSQEDKKQLIEFAGYLLSEEIKASSALRMIEDSMSTFPEFTSTTAVLLKDARFQKNLRTLIKILADENVQKDLSGFLSNKGLFEFISILTKDSARREGLAPELKVTPRPTVTYVETRTASQQSIITRACFDGLTQKYDSNSDYYSIVNELPESCLSVIGNVGFTGQIYVWMNASNAYFKDHYQVGDFHSATGVWAPGMLQFIFTAAVEADMALKSSDGKTGILQNIDEIHRVVTEPVLLETFHQFSTIYGAVESKINIEKRILNYVQTRNDEQLNNVVSDAFDIVEKAPVYIDLKLKPTSCKQIASNLGANPCLSANEKQAKILDMLRILKRKNEQGTTLIRELLQWIHPEGGIDLPFRKIKTSTHKASIEELIYFLYDLSRDTTQKSFVYRTATNSKTVSGTVIDRLEVVIRDVAFLDNFYGAYFKNDVAGASNYRRDVADSEKLLKLLDRSGGIMRGLNGIPDDSKHRLKNMRETYSSLVELSDSYVQPDGSVRSYGPFIQSMLAAIARSSKVSTQNFNPYRVPNEKVVKGHNGLFLTRIVEMSGLRHMASFVRNHFDENLSALKSEDFKKINKNLIGRHKLSDLQRALQRVFDKYLDNDRNQLNLMLEDALAFIDTMTPSEQEMLEEIALKAMILLSNESISTENIQELAPLLEMGIELWPEIRQIVKSIDDRSTLLKFTNSLLDNLLNKPTELNRLVTELKDAKILALSDLRTLIQDPNLRTKLSVFTNQLLKMEQLNSNLNWHETFKNMFSKNDTQWESLKTWLAVALGEDKQKLTLSLLIEFLGDKDQEGYRFKRVMDELFLNHRAKIKQFLEETFKSLQLISD